jgi:CRISPR/Cas system-associated exonuclease Cas4 (RecB family)
MNEGAFPANPRQHSFIPYNIRKAYELPNYDHQDAIYAYLFYRIIQRAKNVHFYYNTESGLNQGGEMSRYLLQLGYESHFDIKKFVLNNPVDLPLPQPIVIEKNEDVLKMMDKFKVDSVSFSRRLTPSAINTYLDCKLKFYLRYVAGIKEPDKMEDEIDPRIFGNLLHNTMELLYKDLVEHKGSMEITADDLTDLNEKLNKVVEKAFKLQYDISEDKDFAFEGRNVLAKSMVIKFASKIIENDRKYAPFNIIGLEADEDYFLDLNINTSDKKSVIGLKGIIDRIDLKDSIVRVIDYKTGKDDKGFENIKQLFDADDAKRNKAAMQTILYCLLYASAGNNSEKVIMPGIFNSREMFDNDFDFRLGIKTPRKSELAYINDIRSILVPFQTALSSLLEQMFSTDQPFDQTEDLKKCELCPYAQICHR